MKVLLGATLAAVAGVQAQDGGGGTTITFQKCDNSELHFMFGLDYSGSMRSSVGSGTRMTEAMKLVREVSWNLYKQTTFPCLEWEAENSAIGLCRQNGFTIMRTSLHFWSSDFASYESKYGHANYKRLWYEYATKGTVFDNNIGGTQPNNEVPVLTHDEIRNAYGLKEGQTPLTGTDRENARQTLLNKVQADIEGTGNDKPLPNTAAGGGTRPGKGVRRFRTYTEASIDPNSVELVTFMLTDGTYMYTCAGGTGSGYCSNQITSKYTIGNDRLKPEYAMITNFMDNGGGKATHYGLGIAGSKDEQQSLFNAAGVAFSYSPNPSGLVQTISSQALTSCVECQLNLQTGEVSGIGCGGSDTDSSAGEQVDGQRYSIRAGKKDDLPVTSNNWYEDVCEQENFYVQGDVENDLILFENINTCKHKLYRYCGDADGEPVSNQLCGLGPGVPYVFTSAQAGVEVTDCECSCTGTVGEDYFCSPSLTSNTAYLANLRTALGGGEDVDLDTNDESEDSDESYESDDDGSEGVPPNPSIESSESDDSSSSDSTSTKGNKGAGAVFAPTAITMMSAASLGLLFLA